MSEALVVGGGPAGAAVAITLARAGRQVVLVEREAEPRDKVCGEFLSAEALGYLAELAVDVESLGAVPIDAVRLVRGCSAVERGLPFRAMSLSRRRLDETLLEQAADAGVCVVRGRRVDGLERDGHGWAARLDSERRITAENVFLCSGKHDVRGWRRPPGMQRDLVAFKMHWRLAAEQYAALGRCVELVIFEGGYGGLEPVEDGVANLCLLVQRERLRHLDGWDGLLEAIRAECAHLDRRLGGAVARWGRPLALSAIPYGYVCSQSDGVWRLGDQAAVIPSFSGDGISIALHSARVAAEMFLAGGSAEHFQQSIRHDVARQVLVATTISRAMIATPHALMTVARLWPGVLRMVARMTRIREDVVRDTLAGHRSKPC